MGRKRSRICAELSSAVGRHPSLLRALPPLLASLDRGAPTTFTHLDRNQQRALRGVFESLPLKERDDQGQGSWTKDTDCESVSEVLLAALTKKGVIRDEGSLLPSERLATCFMDHLACYLEEDQIDPEELRGIFESLSTQGMALLSSFRERVWFTSLAQAAAAVGLLLTDCDELRIPDSLSSSSVSELQECCTLLRMCLGQPMEPSLTSPSQSQVATASIDQHEVAIGPARPTLEETAMSANSQLDSDEDMVGPLPAEAEAYRGQGIVMVSSAALEGRISKTSGEEPIREEWMMSPGERDPFAGTCFNNANYFLTIDSFLN